MVLADVLAQKSNCFLIVSWEELLMIEH